MASTNAADVLPLLNQILGRLSVIETKIQGGDVSSLPSTGSAAPVAAAPSAPSVNKAITGFDAYCTKFLDPFVAACEKLGAGDTTALGKCVKDCWGEMRKFIVMACACKDPGDITPEMLAGMMEKMKALKDVSAKVKPEWILHSKTVGEGIASMSWVCIKPGPKDFVESYVGGSDYHSNSIRKEHRGKNLDQIAFCDTFKSLLTGLMAYIKEYHLPGLTWNPKGVAYADYKPDEATAAAPAVTPAAAPSATSATTTSGGAKVDLAAALNKGGDITSGLKTVTKDMQTWRAEFKGGDAPAPAPVKAPPKKAAEVMKKPPHLEYQQAVGKWLVEYQVASVDIECKAIKDTVYIFGCVGATINVKGKCKSIILDGCKKTNLHFDVAMASVEVVNCQRINTVCRENGSVSSVAIDKTDGIVITLPTSSMHTEVVASKSSEMNLSFPDPDGEMVEKPIPEQYIHRIKDMKITADVSDLYSG